MSAPLRYQRNPYAATHIVDSDVFLVTRTTIINLNATAAVIWLTIEDPSTRRDILGILSEVFASVEPRQLARDLDQFLRRFVAEGLIVVVRRQAAKKAAN